MYFGAGGGAEAVACGGGSEAAVAVGERIRGFPAGGG